jgi:origin recognition complex subunit 1
MSSAPPPTPRRSKRFQPLATPRQKSDNSVQFAWLGTPLYVRPTNQELDLLQEEREELQNNEDDPELETIFYHSFEMKRKIVAKFRGGKQSKGKPKKSANDTYVDKFSIGDTVLIKTDTIYRMHRPPSIGIILAMWETKVKDEEEHQPDLNKMRVRVHWFLRPTELASIRARRDHTKVGSKYDDFPVYS